MDWLEGIAWQGFSIVMPVLVSVAFTAIGLFARKYLNGKARLLYIITEKEMEGQLNTFLSEAIGYANEQVHKAGNTVGGKKSDKMAIALKMAVSLLANSSLPNIAEDRLTQLLEKELGLMRDNTL